MANLMHCCVRWAVQAHLREMRQLRDRAAEGDFLLLIPLALYRHAPVFSTVTAAESQERAAAHPHHAFQLDVVSTLSCKSPEGFRFDALRYFVEWGYID